MTPALLILGLLAGFIALFARPIRGTWYLSEALIAFGIGVATGPVGLSWFSADWRGEDLNTLQTAARLVLGLTIMEIALRLPQAYPMVAWRSLVAVLGGVMPLMALISGMLILALTDQPLWVALLIGAITIPTDPVIASAILTGRLACRALPAHTRHLLAAESGSNDGVAYPLILLCILMVTLPAGEALPQWLGRVLLWEVLGGVALGIGLGRAAGAARCWSEKRAFTEPDCFGFYVVALTLVLLALSTWLNLDGFLAVFAAGIAYRMRCGEVKREYAFQQGLSSFLMFPAFVLVGAAVPWSSWGELGWPGAVLALTVVLLRRLPAMMLLARWTPELKDRRDVLFIGWFGPIGVDTFFFALFAVERTGLPVIWEIGSLLLVASLFAHGLTATPFTRLFQRSGAARNHES